LRVTGSGEQARWCRLQGTRRLLPLRDEQHLERAGERRDLRVDRRNQVPCQRVQRKRRHDRHCEPPLLRAGKLELRGGERHHAAFPARPHAPHDAVAVDRRVLERGEHVNGDQRREYHRQHLVRAVDSA
jgi:hypothetical protein